MNLTAQKVIALLSSKATVTFYDTSIGYAGICYASFWGHVVLIKTIL